MISIDSNLLLYGIASDLPEHPVARAFLEGLVAREDVALSEFVLVELYRLLRLPVLHSHPLRADQAVAVIQQYRHHPRWRILGFPNTGSAELHDELWRIASQVEFAYRRIFDARLALTMRHHGVTEFATANVKDFQGFGFARVWNPLQSE
jgi:toxin-antitoxin system PIN domain toxin